MWCLNNNRAAITKFKEESGHPREHIPMKDLDMKLLILKNILTGLIFYGIIAILVFISIPFVVVFIWYKKIDWDEIKKIFYLWWTQ
jgi:hypothetical protein